MKRTQVYLTEEQDQRLARVAEARGTSRASALRWALDTALVTGDAEKESRRVILATAGLLRDYPGGPSGSAGREGAPPSALTPIALTPIA
jgi:hypothetical protein